MSLTYSTGEPVLKGDHIRYHGEVGEVEFLGSVFVDHPSADVDLEFVSRGTN
jgi:hypothetical protein